MILIYDNGGKTLDRYTAINTRRKTRRQPWAARNAGCWAYEAVFSGDDPRGMSGHCEATRGRHLGKRVKLEDLPHAVRALVEDFASC